MIEQVMHTGKVVSMTPQLTTVQIVSQSACSECHAAGLCGLSEYTEKAIQVPTDPHATYGVGEAVSGLAGIAAVGVYYFVVWLFRDRLRNEYVFTIQQQ